MDKGSNWCLGGKRGGGRQNLGIETYKELKVSNVKNFNEMSVYCWLSSVILPTSCSLPILPVWQQFYSIVIGTTLTSYVWQVEFKDTIGVIRIYISKKDRQHNGQKKKDKVVWINLLFIHISNTSISLRHDITEILIKLPFNTHQSISLRHDITEILIKLPFNTHQSISLKSSGENHLFPVREQNSKVSSFHSISIPA